MPAHTDTCPVLVSLWAADTATSVTPCAADTATSLTALDQDCPVIPPPSGSPPRDLDPLGAFLIL